MNTRILITGSTGVIGQASARAFAREGRILALHFHSSKDKAEELKKACEGMGAEVHLIQMNLAKEGEPERLIEEATKMMDGLGVLVHTAAVFEKTPFGTVTSEQWDRVLHLGLKATFFLAQAAALAMQRGGGRMIFMTDVAAVKPYAGYLPYCIAKAGIDCIVRGLARSLAPRIQVNGVAPYVVSRPSAMSERGWQDLINKTPMRRASTPEEIASVVAMLADSGESITGQIISIDGGRLLR